MSVSFTAKIVHMARRARVVTWNGKDVPAELRELPAGRYVVEAVEEEAPQLSPEEEAGIEAALESYRQGRVIDAKRGPRNHRRRSRALKITCTDEAIADVVDAITYLNKRNPTAAAKLDDDISGSGEVQLRIR